VHQDNRQHSRAGGSPAARQVPPERGWLGARVVAEKIQDALPGSCLGLHAVGFPKAVGVLGNPKPICDVTLEQRLNEPSINSRGGHECVAADEVVNRRLDSIEARPATAKRQQGLAVAFAARLGINRHPEVK
jgi:hypothetical protein